MICISEEGWDADEVPECAAEARNPSLPSGVVVFLASDQTASNSSRRRNSFICNLPQSASKKSLLERRGGVQESAKVIFVSSI